MAALAKENHAVDIYPCAACFMVTRNAQPPRRRGDSLTAGRSDRSIHLHYPQPSPDELSQRLNTPVAGARGYARGERRSRSLALLAKRIWLRSKGCSGERPVLV